jgi:hypothetical protein
MKPIRHLKHPNKLTTEGGFRLVRAFTPDHNARRLRHYVAGLSRYPEALKLHRRVNLKNRRVTVPTSEVQP